MNRIIIVCLLLSACAEEIPPPFDTSGYEAATLRAVEQYCHCYEDDFSACMRDVDVSVGECAKGVLELHRDAANGYVDCITSVNTRLEGCLSSCPEPEGYSLCESIFDYERIQCEANALDLVEALEECRR